MEKVIKRSSKITPLIGCSDFIEKANELVKNVSPNNASVLLIGERGTGKRLIAQNIHAAVSEDKKDFYEINCKSFSKTDVQLMFNGFGRFFKSGKRVTVFINYINELELDLQLLFLNTIKSMKASGIDFKIICSSEQGLEDLVSNSLFVPELYYQINTVTFNVLPLRQRKQDILPISEYYFNQFVVQSGFKFTGFSENAKEELVNQFWKGNIDELINSIQRAFIVGDEPVIRSCDLGLVSSENVVSNSLENVLEDKTLKTAIDSFKREYLIKILEENDWNQTKTAGILGIQRTYVIRLMNELQIRKN